MTIEVDKDLAVTAMAIIETHPDRWDQGSWRMDPLTGPVGRGRKPLEDFADDPLNEDCGTTGCLAGWVAFLDRVKWGANKHMTVGGQPLQFGDMVQNPDRCVCAPDARFCTCENLMPVQEYARLRLGMNPQEADALFNGDNGLEDLKAGVKALANGQDVAWAVHQSHQEHGNEACSECFDDWDSDDDEEDEREGG